MGELRPGQGWEHLESGPGQEAGSGMSEVMGVPGVAGVVLGELG